ncbi:hypothetical protein D3C72_1459180 [compost metagenome]
MRQHGDVGLGVILHERGDRPRQKGQRQRRCGGNLQRPALHVADLQGRLRNPVDPHQRALHLLEQRLRLGGGMEPAAQPLEQGKPYRLFQIRDQARGGWLRDVQHLGGARDGLAEHHGPEGFELADFHAASL